MKLSKNEIIDLILLSRTSSKPSAAHAAEMKKLEDELNSTDLEIEGYERVQWTKFDPGEPKTFPACNYEVFLIAAQKSLEPPTFTVMPECATEALLEEIRHDIIKFKLNVYWRPLPPPPEETEARK